MGSARARIVSGGIGESWRDQAPSRYYRCNRNVQSLPFLRVVGIIGETVMLREEA